jgi:hypothetical protein
MLQRGALVQIVRDVIGVVPSIIPFQYNPEKLSRTITPYNPTQGDQNERGTQAPTVQPFEPQESFTLSLELDATDGLDDGVPMAIQYGIADRLAALQKLLLPSQGLLGDVGRNLEALRGRVDREVTRPAVPLVLFVWGPGRILPVRVTSFQVEETSFSPTLYPVQATVSLGFEVLTPDAFSCREDVASRLAIAAYHTTRAHEATLAITNIATNVDSIRGLLPF